MKILYNHRTTASDGSPVRIEVLSSALRGLGAEVVSPKPVVLQAAYLLQRL